jgi:hypothetical protein
VANQILTRYNNIKFVHGWRPKYSTVTKHVKGELVLEDIPGILEEDYYKQDEDRFF